MTTNTPGGFMVWMAHPGADQDIVAGSEPGFFPAASVPFATYDEALTVAVDMEFRDRDGFIYGIVQLVPVQAQG